jgi:CHAT domain-containing protein
MIDKQSWYIFYLISKTQERQEIIKKIENQLIEYLEKTKIADYFSLMLMEIIQNGEKAHLEKTARARNILKENDEIDTVLKDQNTRQIIIDQAKKWNHNLSLMWKFENPDAINSEYKLSVLLTNKGVVGDKTREKMQQKIKAEVKERDLSHFYEDADPLKLGAGLGLFYLSYIEEACKKEDIKFESRIITDEKKEETIVHMSLNF